jgi:hypothetical protein
LIDPVKSPFREEGWAKMRRRHAGPVKDLFRNPVILGSVTFGLPARRNLGHVHHDLDASLLRCLSEVGRCLQDAGPDGVNKIRALNSFKCRADGLEIQQIAPHNFGTLGGQSRRTFILVVNECTYAGSCIEQEFHGFASRRSSRSRH